MDTAVPSAVPRVVQDMHSTLRALVRTVVYREMVEGEQYLAPRRCSEQRFCPFDLEYCVVSYHRVVFKPVLNCLPTVLPVVGETNPVHHNFGSPISAP